VHISETELRGPLPLRTGKDQSLFYPLAAQHLSFRSKANEEEIKKFYDRNQGLLKEPLKVQVEYLSTPSIGSASSAQITDKEIEGLLSSKSRLKIPQTKEVKARYILIRVQRSGCETKKRCPDACESHPAEVRAERISLNWLNKSRKTRLRAKEAISVG